MKTYIITKDFRSFPATMQGKEVLPDKPSGPFKIKGTKVFIIPSSKGYEMAKAKDLGIPKSILGTKLTDEQQLRLASKTTNGINLIVNKDDQLVSLNVKIYEKQPYVSALSSFTEPELQSLRSSVAAKLAQTTSVDQFKETALSFGASYKYLNKNNLFTDAQKRKISHHYKALENQTKKEKSLLKAAFGQEKDLVKISSNTREDHSLITAQKAERDDRIEATEPMAKTEKKEKKRELKMSVKRSAGLGSR